ncbi:MAG TPA: DUF5591 domain-containing protein [Thermoplasmata archaeon]|nr:DUF5591 domain-containing protein [Thermoplasmata archaeon]
MPGARSIEGQDGLCLLGRAPLGELWVRTPEIAVAGPPEGPSSRLHLESAPAPAGLRRLTLSADGARLPLELPVLAPEILGPPSDALRVAPGVRLVHAPLPPGPREAVGRDVPELIVLGNARALWAEGRPFVEAVRAIRERWGGRPVVWAPRVALPHRVAFLAYVGVDLLDDTEGRWVLADGGRLDPVFGRLDPSAARSEQLDEPDPAVGGTVASGRAGLSAAYARALAEARTAARVGRLRELVESRQTSEPTLAELLRYADRELAGALEEREPVVGRPRTYVLSESFRRPEMARFRRRVLERYRPPPSKRVLLLVPCSKTKPYRRSHSHRRFSSALEGLPAIERVHLVSVSAPIGLVPQELEDVPPARHYDIPVTGDWSEPEREVVLAGIAHLLSHGPYRSVVVHLDPREYAFLAPALEAAPGVRWTIPDDRTTSASALAALRAALEDALAAEAPVAGGPLAVVREELAEVASVQFGRAAAERLFAPPLRLAGRPWFQRLTDGRSDLATLREERGLFFLTAAGARRLFPEPPLWVDVDPRLSLSGDLFAPGVRDADPAIRPGDSVVLRRETELAGVGEAVLDGRMMTELGHGLAVRVRHRAARPPTPP